MEWYAHGLAWLVIFVSWSVAADENLQNRVFLGYREWLSSQS